MAASPFAASSSSSSSSSSSASSASSSSSRLHESSLVDASLHHPALDELRALPVNEHLTTYVVDCVAEVVQHAMLVTHAHQQQPNQPTTTPPRLSSSRKAALHTFVDRVLTASKASTSIILVTLVYIHRARPHLRVSVDEWALERVFLGALILASKYTNDVGLKNRHWAVCTGVFGRRDVSRVEREFLEVLDFELGVSELDLLRHYAGLTLQAKGRRALADGAAHQLDAGDDMWENSSESGWSDSSDEESEGPLTPACELPAADERCATADYFSVAPAPASVRITTYPSHHHTKSVSSYVAQPDYFAMKNGRPPVSDFALQHPHPLPHSQAAMVMHM